MITPMEAYATTDGVLHMHKNVAIAHQHGLDMKKEIEEYAGKRYIYEGFGRASTIQDWEVHKKLQELNNAM